MSNIHIKKELSDIIKTETVENSGEIQYVYDDTTQMLSASPIDLNNFPEIILEDGTRAVDFNGTLITSDGQIILLKDEGSHTNDEKAAQIIISNDQDQQLFETVGSPNIDIDTNIIRYIQNEEIDLEGSQQVIFLQEDGQPIQMNVKDNSYHYGVTGVTDDMPIKMVQSKSEDETIDLEQLLSQQGVMPVEGGNYQYAVLKDGKFHIQSLDHIFGMKSESNEDTSTSGSANSFQHNVNLSSGFCNFSNLAAIKGRNLLTGQPITLSKYMDKMHNFKLSEEDKHTVNTIQESPLKKLINKKIPLCRTGRGRLLVGKIINVTKKNGSQNTIEINSDCTQKDTDISSSTTKPKMIRNYTIKNTTCKDNTSGDNVEVKLKANEKPSAQLSDATTTINSAQCNNENQNEDSELDFSVKMEKLEKSFDGILDSSKVVVQKKFVTKDCFSVITRTLCGLMNMDSVVKKLRNRTIILKVLEKTFVHSINDYNKSVSYCSGYMVREYKLNEEEDNFSESWKFIPDANSKDIILGEAGFDVDSEESINIKKSVNVTIQITVNPEGNRTSRVIINPPNMYRCKQVQKSANSTSSYFSCELCPMKFSNKQVKDDHMKIHQTESHQTKYECMECKKRLKSSSELEKHVNTFCKPMPCRYCSERPSNMRLLRKHLLTHMKPVQAHARQASTDESVNSESRTVEQKMYFCDICGRQFSRHSNLQRHIEIHKGRGAMYKCTICNCSYHYVSSLTRHMISCHLDTTKRPHLFKNAKPDNQENCLSRFNILDDMVEVIPLNEIDEGIQFQQVDMEIDGVENVAEGMEILQIPVNQNFVVDN